MNTCNIFILDDNEAFLKFFHHRVERQAYSLQVTSHCNINIHSFSHAEYFKQKLDHTVDLVIMDYNLGHGLNAFTLLDSLMHTHSIPDIILISESQGLDFMFKDLRKHVKAFIRKDEYLPAKACILIEEFIETQMHG